jgi:GNAT superfamily N-acetyltransferase
VEQGHVRAHEARALTIRTYRDEDFAAAVAIHDRARPDELAGSCDPRGFIPLANDAPSLADFHRSRKWVAVEDERIVGFVGVDGSCLSWLYVDPSRYGAGIGRALLQLALREAGPDAWTIALDGNARARALYASEGFEVVRTFAGENNGYPCACVRMALRAGSGSGGDASAPSSGPTAA